MEFVLGGLAATSAGVLTNPLEVVKHHMEMSKKSQFNDKTKGFIHTGFKVAKRDGIKSLQKGLSPALGAHLTSYGMKLGTYNFAQNRGITTNVDGQVVVFKSVSASAVGGLVGQYVSNPFYLLKAEHAMHVAETQNKKLTYTDTVKKIYQQHGIKGFFRGATTSLPRAFIGTSQLTSFAVTKENLVKFEFFSQNKMLTSLIASGVAGLVLAMATTPFELVISKMYTQAINPTAKLYEGYLDCLKKTYAQSGLRPFYKGLGPIYLKLGPHTVLCLTFWEVIKGAYYNPGNESYVPGSNDYSTVPNSSFYETVDFASTINEFAEDSEKVTNLERAHQNCYTYWN